MKIVDTLEFTGILKLGLKDPAHAIRLQGDLPEDAVPLVEKDLHVTMIHQAILKPLKKLIKTLEDVSSPPVIELEDVIHRIERPDRVSWIVLAKNQGELQAYVDRFMERIGGDPKPEVRVFHVTLANLSGSPFQSVGDVNREDIGR